MSQKNPTRGQQKSAHSYQHNNGMSREAAINKAVSEKGADQPKATSNWQGMSTGSTTNGTNLPFVKTESDY